MKRLLTAHLSTVQSGRGARRAAIAGLTACLFLSAPGTAVAASGSDGTDSITVSGVVDEIVIDPGGEFTATGGALTAQEESGKLSTEKLVDMDGTLIDLPLTEATPLADGQSVSVTLTVPDGMSTEDAIDEVGQPADPAEGTKVAVAAVEPVPGSNRPSEPSTLTDTGLATVSSHTLTILPVFWTSRDSASRASLQTVADETARFWADQSNGELVTSTQVNDWAQITDPGSCNATTLYNAAMAAHHEAAPNSVRDHVVIYFPYRSDCGGWAGLGSVNGSRVWVNGYPRTDVVAHEIGHNLGLGHANQLTCTSGGAAVPLSAACSLREYYDGADVMGYSTGQVPGNVNTALADGLGFVRHVDASATSPVTVDLAALGQPGQVRTLKIPTWDDVDLYVDFRPATGRDLRVPSWAGVQIHRRIEEPNWPPTSELLNLQAALGNNRVSMLPGTSYAIPRSDYTLSVISVSATAARVRVAPTAIGNPRGSVDSTTTAAGRITTTGWALDPNTSAPIMVQMYVDSSANAVTWASTTRPDIGVAFPSAGSEHGFNVSVGTTPGRHTVCVYALNTGPGSTISLGCQVVVVPTSNPFGQIDGVSGTASKITASGWAIDPDTSAPIIVQMYIDGARNSMTWATQARADIGRAFPLAGSGHGYTLSMAAVPGWHTVCLIAINTGLGSSSSLGCRVVNVPSSDPFGQIDAVTAGSRTVRAQGWAIDPDTAAPIMVQMYIDGRANSATWASAARTDIGRAFPASGALHGYSLTMSVEAGSHTVCLIAINTGAGGSTGLGCRAVSVL